MHLLGADVDEKLFMSISGLAHTSGVCATFFANRRRGEKRQRTAKYIAVVSAKIETIYNIHFVS